MWVFMFKVHGYVFMEDNAWKLAILNGVHNHEMVSYVAGHLLAGRLIEMTTLDTIGQW